MNPRLRVLLFAAVGVLLALVMGVEIANDRLMLTLVVLGVLLWATIEWTQGPLPEAWLLAWALVGYILGNRGFAQVNLSRYLPLLPAETVLLVGVPALIARLALGKARAVFRDPLNYAVIAWIVVGAARVPLDLKHYGFYALRDFAMVYYALFFFLAQACAGHPASARLLRGAVTASCLTLPVIVAIQLISPQFFLSHLFFRGIPLVYHKSDLLAAYLAGAFFWLWTRWEKSGHRPWLAPAAVNLLMLGLVTSPRAAMAALALVTLMWLAARRWRVAAAQVLIVGGAGCLAVFVTVVANRDLKQTAVYSAYEHALSIADVAGTGTYVNQESGDPGLNNRFRLTWWRTVARDTLAQNPVFGLGFGYDLAARFLVEYDLIAAEDFTTRSPHSMIMSVFGRMGFVGLVLWGAVALGMLGLTRRCFRAGDHDALGLVSVAWVLWFSACVGVVLEGPMGAVVFWTVLGLANHTLAEGPAGEPAAVADLQPGRPADEVAASP